MIFLWLVGPLKLPNTSTTLHLVTLSAKMVGEIGEKVFGLIFDPSRISMGLISLYSILSSQSMCLQIASLPESLPLNIYFQMSSSSLCRTNIISFVLKTSSSTVVVNYRGLYRKSLSPVGLSILT